MMFIDNGKVHQANIYKSIMMKEYLWSGKDVPTLDLTVPMATKFLSPYLLRGAA